MTSVRGLVRVCHSKSLGSTPCFPSNFSPGSSKFQDGSRILSEGGTHCFGGAHELLTTIHNIDSFDYIGEEWEIKMDLLGSILNSMDAPPSTENKKAKGIVFLCWFPLLAKKFAWTCYEISIFNIPVFCEWYLDQCFLSFLYFLTCDLRWNLNLSSLSLEKDWSLLQQC